jgi:hypothetical protein
MSDFEQGEIQIRYNSTDYGPFTFLLEDQAPGTAILQSVTVRSFKDRVREGEDLATKVETTTELIDSLLTAVSGSYTIGVFFNYPGVALEGNHTLVFEVVWNNGAHHPYYFWKVVVK